LFQERDFEHRNWEASPIDPGQIDLVLLTHAHIDHCGLLPRLVKQGFRGDVVATWPTLDLARILLTDAARIQLEDITYKRKRHAREGRVARFPYEPLYTEEDVDKTVDCLRGVAYREKKELGSGIEVTFHDAGHILGSASLEIRVADRGNVWRTLIFSGDIGQWNKPIIRDPTLFSSGDYVVIESTYGARLHEDRGDVATQLAEVAHRTVQQGGKLIIPTFAVERAQELIYHIGQLVRAGRIPDLPVYLDSPMAIDATEIYRRHRSVFDEAAWNLISSGTPLFRFPGLRMSRTTEESTAINRLPGPAIIMSTSGMCTAGRIKHHLRHHIGDPNSTILFVGYQATGTLGRLILDGQREVRIHGQRYPVRASVAQIFGFSGHADRNGLLRWRDAFSQPPRQAFVTHGEEEAALSLAEALRENAWQASVPKYKQIVCLD
jgi:metallo-beta-lactamase family protein